MQTRDQGLGPGLLSRRDGSISLSRRDAIVHPEPPVTEVTGQRVKHKR